MFDQFQQMPKGMKIFVGALICICLLAVAYMVDPRAPLIVAAGLILIALAVFAWMLYQKWQGKKRAKALGGQLSSHSAGAPNAINDPAHLAKLDDLRQNFSRGLEKFQAVGKDLYSLPWYIVCGAPGSGKTEAVRRCKVGFPPGLQDEMQGAGGTINMHWWFTNYAVLIDTAGKLLFQEAPPGKTTEWLEFLNLLKKARPNCPINGLLLVIPSESLIEDTVEEIQRDAGKIAQQLQTIQRTLDVRFPVFVLITKCDKIIGFHEFFTGIKDPALQDQMMGWSNPASLDTPFRPDAVDQHLADVVQRIGRRRLGLLRDPVPATAGKRRVDEVDALFVFPQSVAALAPRLRKYLEIIFVAGEWSARPLFLRGIYFSSALTDGKELDMELANALGLPMDKLPEGSKAWERETSFFLRDLFVQKVFREKGLVTRATNTNKQIRARQRIIGSVVVVGMLAVLAVSIFGYRALKSSIGEELIYWHAGARAENWSGNRWKPIVNPKLEYTGNDIVQLDENREWPIVEFHEKLQQRVGADLVIPWVFKPVESLAMQANPSRRQAQRVLFEASAIAPLIEANRDRLVNSAGWSAPDAERMAALLRLEGAIYLKDQPGFNTDYPPEDLFPPLLAPSLKNAADSTGVMSKLMQIYQWTYFGGGAGRGRWPADWMSRGKTLRDNQPLLRAWDALDKSMQASQGGQRDAILAVQAGRLTVVRFNDAERAFLKAVSLPRTNAATWTAGVASAWTELAPRRAAMDKLVEELRTKTGIATGELTLDGSYRTMVSKMRADAAKATQLVRGVLAKQKPAADAAAKATSGPVSEFTLYRDLERRLAGMDAQITSIAEQLMPPSEQAQLADLDAVTLRPIVAGGAGIYSIRCDAYADIMQVISPQAGEGVSMFGKLGEVIGQQTATLASLRDRVPKYDGALRPEFSGAMRILMEAGATLGLDGSLENYRKEFDAAFPDNLGFPLGTGPVLTPAQLKSIRVDLEKVRADAKVAGVPEESRRTMEGRFEKANRYALFAAQLIGSDGDPAPVKLVLLRDKDQQGVLDRAGGAMSLPRQAMARIYPSMRVTGRSFRLRGLPDDVEVDKFTVATPLPKIELFTGSDPKPEADAVVESAGDWGALRLLLQGAERHTDGKVWDTVIHLNDRGKDLVVAVSLNFDQALPPLDKWPTAGR